jgi:hypothetical protein
MGALFSGRDYKGRSTGRATIHQSDSVFEGVSVVWPLFDIHRTMSAADLDDLDLKARLVSSFDNIYY